MDIEENWEKVVSIPVPVGTSIEDVDVAGKLPASLSGAEKEFFFVTFIKGIYKFYSRSPFHFSGVQPLGGEWKQGGAAGYESKAG